MVLWILKGVLFVVGVEILFLGFLYLWFQYSSADYSFERSHCQIFFVFITVFLRGQFE